MKSLLISGSSRGLGRELSLLLAQKGYRVFTMGFQTHAPVDFSVDLSDRELTNQTIQGVGSGLAPLSVIVCNAGTGKAPRDNMSKDELADFFYNTNFVTAKNLVESSLPLLDVVGSSVIGISSIAALAEVPGAPYGYAESKRQLNEYFRQMALKYAQKRIRFNLLSLGNVNFAGSRWEEKAQENPQFVANLLKDRVPLNSFISPREVADAIDFLSSPSAVNITGANLVIDGGQSL